MKYAIALLLAAVLATPAAAQTSFYTLKAQANTAYEAKKYQEAGQRFEQAFRVPRAQPNASDYYNAACSWALAGDATKAFAKLDQAIAAGYDNKEHLRQDADLASLYADPRWQPMLGRLDAAIARAEAHQNVALKNELAEIYENDQTARRKAADLERRLGPKAPGLDSLWKQMERADNRNLPRVTAMIDRYGWPGKSLVGRQGSTTAFLVIQHSDLATMQKYLPLMRQATAKGELDKSALALVEDRVLTFQGKPQIYGSQLRGNSTTGKMEFDPISDEAHVDERRATMGLGPIAEYAKGFGIEYVPAKKP
jgi:tetratricopeptide (TPR) repeat protein